MTGRTDLDLGAIRDVLKKEQAELLASSEAAADDRKPVELDQQSVGRLSRMDALQNQAMANALETHRQTHLHQIEAALKRLEEGDYGYCTGCGDEIPAKRLEIDPAIALCVKCAS
jgi:RNA polymerase-binding transcription factor